MTGPLRATGYEVREVAIPRPSAGSPCILPPECAVIWCKFVAVDVKLRIPYCAVFGVRKPGCRQLFFGARPASVVVVQHDGEISWTVG
jgi:hypothetical protein